MFNGFNTVSVLMSIGVVLLLSLSALVSGSETAFFSLTPSDMQHLKNHPSRANNSVLKLLEDQDYLLATLLITNNLVNICIVLMANRVIDLTITFGGVGWEFATKVVLVTFLLLLFGEITPKIYAAYNSITCTKIGAVIIVPLKTIFKPFSYLLIRSGDRVSDTFARHRVTLTMEELSDAIEITNSQSDEEKQMLSGIVGFVNKDVQTIMKLRLDIVALDIETGFDEVKKVIIGSGFSRIPVYHGNLDNIKGILYVKDMLRFVGSDDDFEWRNHIRKPYFIPDNKKINDLLEEFQSSKVHVAVVVDEYGSTQGLVSLEDILEEIVGEITDESDMDDTAYHKKIDDNNFLFEGKTHLSDFAQVMGIEQADLDSHSADAETIAGLMLELNGDFLEQGDSVVIDAMKLTVESLDRRRIDKVHVTRL